MINRIAVKPCPFCDHVGLIFATGSTPRWLAYACAECGIGTETRVQSVPGKTGGSPAQWRCNAERDAVEAWNRRTP